MTIRVEPDGPIPCDFAIVGEGPAAEEVKRGRGFVGPSGDLMWPLVRRLAALDRSEVYVTNLSKTPLDNDVAGEAKMTEAEFVAAQTELVAELGRARPRRVLAVGALASKALLGDRYVGMEECNGIGFQVGPAVVVPTWHPAAALRPGGADRLAYTAAAIAAWREPKMHPDLTPMVPPVSPEWIAPHLPVGTQLGIDTEGTPDDPICMTVASRYRRWYIEPEAVRGFFYTLHLSVPLVFHNAPWDWPVLWAMGAPRDIARRWRWRDTMELAYLRQTEPRGLKDLAYRHLGLRMKTFDEVVQPHYEDLMRAAAEGVVGAATAHITHSPKGRLLKRPRQVVAEDVKPLKRALGNPELLAKRMPWFPKPTLRLVPEAERVEYATMDAWATVMVEEHLQ